MASATRSRAVVVRRRRVIVDAVFASTIASFISLLVVVGRSLPIVAVTASSAALSSSTAILRPPPRPSNERKLPKDNNVDRDDDAFLVSSEILKAKSTITLRSYGVFLRQEESGLLALMEGTPELEGPVIWSNGYSSGDSKDFYTHMQTDGHLMTKDGKQKEDDEIVWKTSEHDSLGDYYFGITENRYAVFVARGTPGNTGSILWSDSTSYNLYAKDLLMVEPQTESTTNKLYRGFTTEATDAHLIAQFDGNVVLYDGTAANRGVALWETGKVTSDSSENYYLRLQNDGHLIAKLDSTKEDLWRTEVTGTGNDFFLMVTRDGNGNPKGMAVYQGTVDFPGTMIWDSSAGEPSGNPTVPPTLRPTVVPTGSPTESPTTTPSRTPTARPSTSRPTDEPSAIPTGSPTVVPTFVPSPSPSTPVPTVDPTTARPSELPSRSPTRTPSFAPSDEPTHDFIIVTMRPTPSPFAAPSYEPSVAPSAIPSVEPSNAPSASPSVDPTFAPSAIPTSRPSTTVPSRSPSASPSAMPATDPTSPAPSSTPSHVPSADPSSPHPSSAPTESPVTSSPSFVPSLSPVSVDDGDRDVAPSNTPSPTPGASSSSPTPGATDDEDDDGGLTVTTDVTDENGNVGRLASCSASSSSSGGSSSSPADDDDETVVEYEYDVYVKTNADATSVLTSLENALLDAIATEYLDCDSDAGETTTTRLRVRRLQNDNVTVVGPTSASTLPVDVVEGPCPSGSETVEGSICYRVDGGFTLTYPANATRDDNNVTTFLEFVREKLRDGTLFDSDPDVTGFGPLRETSGDDNDGEDGGDDGGNSGPSAVNRNRPLEEDDDGGGNSALMGGLVGAACGVGLLAAASVALRKRGSLRRRGVDDDDLALTAEDDETKLPRGDTDETDSDEHRSPSPSDERKKRDHSKYNYSLHGIDDGDEEEEDSVMRELQSGKYRRDVSIVYEEDGSVNLSKRDLDEVLHTDDVLDEEGEECDPSNSAILGSTRFVSTATEDGSLEWAKTSNSYDRYGSPVNNARNYEPRDTVDL